MTASPAAHDPPAEARTTDFTPSDPSQTTAAHVPDADNLGTNGGAANPAAPLPSIPGYEILEVLGRGGMGVVYKARHLALKRTVAVKMILAGGHAGPRELARFRTEAEAVARLQHPNIVQIHDVGEAGGHPYCALEFVDGGTLADRLDGRPLDPRLAADLVGSLARAMQAAHARGVIHRDLKPANVLLAADGTPKVTDFGLARQLDADSGETQAGAVMGTPSYMAPEQAGGRAREAGPAADVYALGAILYECLTGRPPFRGNSVAETLILVQTTEPSPPSREIPRLPRDLETICLKAMAKEPAKRYPSADDLANDLRRFLADEPILARRAGAIERLGRRVRRNPAQVGLTAAVVALAGVVAAVALRPRPDPASPVAAAAAAAPEPDTSTDDLIRAVADLDRTDPDWRFEKIEASRKAIPDDRNGARQIVAFRKRVAELIGRPGSEGDWVRHDLRERFDAFVQSPPTARLSEADARDIAAELVRVGPAAALARKMIDYPEGRFATAYSRDMASTLLGDHQTARPVVILLALDAQLHLHRGNRPEAVLACRAALNCCSAFDGDPLAITQAVRTSLFRTALRTLERILAQGVLADAELQSFQRRIEAELAYPMLATMIRGERASLHYFFGSFHTGDVTPDALQMFNMTDRSELPPAADLRRLHAWLLRYYTQWAEVARRSTEEWPRRAGLLEAELDRAPSAGPRIDEVLRSISPTKMCMNTAMDHAALARTAVAAVAAERYRLAGGGWPADLAALVPAYLKEVPADPYDGKPLRFRRTADGVVVYSVGPDRTDSQGQLHRDRGQPPEGRDVGFQLWDAAKRRPAGGAGP